MGVVNVDKVALSLTLSSGIANEGDTLTLTVARNVVDESPLVVKLSETSTKQLDLPPSVTIPANASSVDVTFTVVADDVPESDDEIQIRASSPNFVAGFEKLTVVADEPTIALSFLSSVVHEGSGPNATVGVVSRAEASSSPLRVRLATSRTDKILIPREVTIPAGKTSVEFTVASLDNGLVDFKIVGSQVNGKDASESPTVNLGDIGPGETAIGQWFMESTLLGRFIDYKATFEHVNGFGDKQFSLIKNVEIRELIRSVYDDRGFADDRPDFLVNEVPDLLDAPDMLYLSTGEVEPVAQTLDLEGTQRSRPFACDYNGDDEEDSLFEL